MTAGYRHLLSPGRIGTMALRNRIVHAPMSLGLGAGDGTCGERYLAYYAERAKGGAGLISIGTVSVGYPEGSVDAKQIAASDDRFLPNLRTLADAIHAHGAKIVLQLNHNGLQCRC
jgi:2,4-dienoyl-CoA reductase (NADPH2)